MHNFPLYSTKAVSSDAPSYNAPMRISLMLIVGAVFSLFPGSRGSGRRRLLNVEEAVRFCSGDDVIF